ncbi:cation-independent mannose-6-phosphate receptor-like [Centruroides sculpturatus]|uniref:cation-independent mannose-6-phosphate receptor-like n=1 Tax=Centruroides sculpturatus TaxID=218467 RepID=UPI000C6EAD2D|nr:cation-independent mannose-6-phosphate receptor-like [Centruroides sculpturatus]
MESDHMETRLKRRCSTDQSVTGCFAFGCTNRSEKGFLMKVFPKDPARGSCQEDEESNKRWNAGLANSKLNFHEGVLTLNYSGGDICHGKYSRHTIIEFKCGSGEGKPMFQFESEDCTYYFIWSTSLACENKKHCIISNGSESYDLTPLSKSTYTVNDLTGKNDLYYLSVCDSVNINGIGCPPDAGICKINKVNKSATSLGIPTSPMIDFEGYVTILYPFGSLCENGKKKLTSRIKFICDTSTEMLDVQITEVIVGNPAAVVPLSSPIVQTPTSTSHSCLKGMTRSSRNP